MAEVSRILTAAGLVIASVGLVVYGMAASYANPLEKELTLGTVLMIIGVIATVIGIVMSKRIAER